MDEQTVAKINHDLVQDWARSHLVAKNATLVLAGQFDAELIKKHIAYNLDQVGGGTDSEDIDDQLPSAIPKYITGIAAKPSPTLAIDLYFLTARGLNANFAKRLVLQEVLAAELGELRNKHALTYGFSVGYHPRKGGGAWVISGDADASRAAEATKATLEILANVRADPESYRGSFVLARQKVLERLLLNAHDSYAVVEQLAYLARFDLDETFFGVMAQEVAKLTLTDFHAFAARELPPNRQVFGAFGNVGAAKAAVAAAKQFAGAPD
jgi:predicted Zn-dependent peptidase